MSNYIKTMTEALREMYPLNEGTIDKVKEIASKKQAMKIDGVMVDSFTASAISQIYDKVNDANKKKMDSLPITKLANLAMKMMQKNEFVPEEVDLDENRVMERFKEKDSAPGITKMSDKRLKFFRKIPHGSYTKAEIEDEILRRKKTGDFVKHIDGIHDSFVEEVGFDKLPDMSDALRQVRMEEVGLDEAPRRPKAPKMKTTDIMRDRGKKAGPKTYQVDIDGSRATVTAASEKMAIQKAMTQLKINKKIKPLPKATVKVVEKTDLDEGKMSQLHQYIKDKKSAEEIAKLMKVDVKTIKALMSSYESTDGDDMSENGAYMEMLAAACGSPAASTYVTHYDPMDEGAAADARRAMSRDKDFSRKDSADDDTDATDDDVKGASKNIMMQMRKAQSLRGRFDVEFADGKKTKVSAGVAMAVQSKYNSLKKPADKEKFQARIGKSYKDMLKALKEELQPKKESILERMNRKIKEKNDG